MRKKEEGSSSNHKRALIRSWRKAWRSAASVHLRPGSLDGSFALPWDGCYHFSPLLYSSSTTTQSNSPYYTQSDRSSTSQGKHQLRQILLPRHAYYASQGHVQEDQMGADATLPRLDRRHASHGLPSARQPERLGDSNVGGADNLLLPLHAQLHSLRQEDTKEVLLVHTLLIAINQLIVRRGSRSWNTATPSSPKGLGWPKRSLAFQQWLRWSFTTTGCRLRIRGVCGFRGGPSASVAPFVRPLGSLRRSWSPWRSRFRLLLALSVRVFLGFLRSFPAVRRGSRPILFRTGCRGLPSCPFW